MSKLIIITMLLIGLVGMIGTAVADATIVSGYVIDESGMGLNGATVSVYDDPGFNKQIGSTLTDNDGFYLISISPQVEDGTNLWVKAEKEAPNGLLSGEGSGTVVGNLSVNIACVDLTLVTPEFPTVALPIAAVLGLMFIISSRKKEE